MKLKRPLTLKTSGEDVRFLQLKLKEYGFFNQKIDGYFGQNLLISVTTFQKKLNLKVDGIVGLQTWSNILHYNPNSEPIKVQQPLDIPHKISFVDSEGFKIYDCLLTDEEYVKEETNKNTIWLHHTAGGSRPDWTISGWEKDYLKQSNGEPLLDEKGNLQPMRVATSYVIGRKSSSNSDSLWDGKVLRAFDDKYWAWHLGTTGQFSQQLNSRSIAIEICNYGPLTIGKDGRFYNWVNKPINESDVVELDKEFRGYKYWEKYTDAQLESTRKLILHLQSKWSIEIEKGIYNEKWFDYNTEYFTLGGLRSHSQVRRDKYDIFPQKEMIQMLNSI